MKYLSAFGIFIIFLHLLFQYSTQQRFQAFSSFLYQHSIPIRNTKRRVVVATLANDAYSPLVSLLNNRLSRLELKSLFVFCADDRIYQFCIRNNISAWFLRDTPCQLSPSYQQLWKLSLGSQLKNKTLFAGTQEFVSFTQLKYLIFYAILSNHYDLLFSDLDILWINNPLQYLLEESSEADILIQTDRKHSSQSLFSYLNTGFLYIRSHCGTQLLLRTMIKHATKWQSQQRNFNQILCRTGPQWYSKRITDDTCLTFLEPDTLFSSCKKLPFSIIQSMVVKISSRVLSPQLFPHGAASLIVSRNGSQETMRIIDMKVSQLPTTFISNIFIIHFNWLKGVVNKSNRIQQVMQHFGLTYEDGNVK
eukprot:jgi/Galph1/3224/GphlegSOOS_G1881.1